MDSHRYLPTAPICLPTVPRIDCLYCLFTNWPGLGMIRSDESAIGGGAEALPPKRWPCSAPTGRTTRAQGNALGKYCGKNPPNQTLAEAHRLTGIYPAVSLGRSMLRDPSWVKSRIAARLLLRRQHGRRSRRDDRWAASLASDPGVTDRLMDQALASLCAEKGHDYHAILRSILATQA